MNSGNGSNHLTWSQLKDQGTSYFESRQFQEAASCWSQAYEQLTALQQREKDENPTAAASSTQPIPASTLLFYQKERQYLLSNLVACKLNMLHESTDNTNEVSVSLAQSIVVLAKECIHLDDKWPKAHVRLASAYIALDTVLSNTEEGGTLGRQHSNDACMALQTALRLDPSYRLARNMLVEELSRRDRRHSSSNPHGSSTSHESSSETLTQNLGSPDEDIDKTPNDPTWFQRWRLEFQAWLQRHPFFTTHDARDIYIALFILLLLYISFDGRFGLTTTTRSHSTTTTHKIHKHETGSSTPSKRRRRQQGLEYSSIPAQENTVPVWLPLLLMLLTTLIFRTPNMAGIRQGIRFPFFRGNWNHHRRHPLFGQLPMHGGPSPFVWIGTVILFLVMAQLFQNAGNNRPIIIHGGFMGPMGFPGMGMGIHLGPFIRDIFAGQFII